ncbi:MAG: hypothetical protein KJO33_00920 [Gammaproteobacteria bacterium]|nr:hypothetical protein [Gammaproteobacteria bacterium]
MKKLLRLACFFTGLLILESAIAADSVPTDVQMPGTQPLEISTLESPNKCDNCHGGYNSAVEPSHNWLGSMMAQAGRDPIFWATLAIAEQDFDGSGDLCLRCHSTSGWLAGRSTPTDGSGLAAGDADGVECDYCHKLTNPDDSEHLGVMNAPFVANDANGGYYGSGMSSLWGGSDKLGPYVDADARHQFMASAFHRKAEFCGSCHDVSNPVVGDLAPNFGQLDSPENVIASGNLGGNVAGKAAFNNPPHRYGVVERTFSEFKSGALSGTRVNDYGTLPDELRGGVLEDVYQASYNPAAQSADYEDGTPRYFTCQTCHLRAVTGTGANKRGVPVRSDLPLHDMTGGNYWMAHAIDYLDGQGKLRLGGGMPSAQVQAMYDGALRAQQQLQLAATLSVEGNEVKIVNHTGHKLITGYPEGRRMWLNIRWYDGAGTLLREDGAYGGLDVQIDGSTQTVRTILDLDGANTKIYEAHMGMTPEWAAKLLTLGYAPDLALSYDRFTGDVVHTLSDLANGSEPLETFHFALNNTVVSDNRIPPFGMDYNEARRRNASPVPPEQYEGVAGGLYEHYDEVALNPPPGSASATVDLLYQPTSWEYIQFLYLANDGGNAFLADEGANMLDAWLNAGLADGLAMAEPLVMASTTWGDPVAGCDLDPPTLLSADAVDKAVTLAWSGPAEGEILAYSLYYDQSDKTQPVTTTDCTAGPCTGYTDTGLTNGQTYCYVVAASDGSCESGYSNVLCATPQPPGQEVTASATILETGRWIRVGKGKNAEWVWEPTANFTPGDGVVVRLEVRDEDGAALAGATVSLSISGPEQASLVSEATDGNGTAEASWSTEAPNKKGQGGTPPGAYTATVAGMNSDTHDWDGVSSEAPFGLGQANSATRKGHHGG